MVSNETDPKTDLPWAEDVAVSHREDGGSMDPGLNAQFERDEPVVKPGPETVAGADALQHPHYEPPS